MGKSLFTISMILITHISFSQPQLAVQTIATGFSEPVCITNAGDDRLFIVEKDGIIKILYADGTTSVFMNIDPKVGSGGGEQGLLGLAFHPDYVSNGYFYVNYTNNSGNTRVSRFSVDATNPNLGNSLSELPIITISQPFTNHNGGDLAFGPDGYLYIPTGDGGSGDDPGDRAQDITSQKLGKILRLDVDGASPYAIPADNPFVGITGDDEIWAYGLRNPWRFSFDRLTGDMWIGDVGQGEWEEVDFQPASSTGGENYGWRCYEGDEEHITSTCDLTDPFVFPVLTYDHSFGSGGYAITGGYVYRGSEFPGMYGYYVVCDYVTGNFWTIYPDGVGGWNTEFSAGVQSDISSFGEGANGEIYACNLSNGNIYHVIDENCGPVWGVAVSGITSTTATISWEDVGSSNYKLQYKKTGMPWTTVSTTGTSVSLTGLTPGTNYNYRIRNKCAGVATLYTKNGTFSTPVLREAETVKKNIDAQFISNNADAFFILNAKGQNIHVLIRSMNGNILLEKMMADNEEIDLTNLNSGIYIAEFVQEGVYLNNQKIVIGD